MECTNPSNNPSFSKQHSSLFTGGFGGERDTWTEAAERSTRATSIAVGEKDKACKRSTLELSVSVESIPMSARSAVWVARGCRHPRLES